MKRLSLRERAIGLLARREHSRLELGRKLARHATEPGEVEVLLDELQRRKLLSDERYAEVRAHSLSSRYGAARIAYELRMKGVADTTVRQIARELKSSELERARIAWAKRFDQLPQNALERGRQMRFLGGRGFSADIIASVLRRSEDT